VKIRFPRSFVAAALSSLAAVAVEFALLTLLVSVLHLHYLASAALVTVAYVAINFTLNRRWAFRAGHAPAAGQLARHVGVTAVGLGNALMLMRLSVGDIGLPYQLGWATHFWVVTRLRFE
jgi:putative flippase GtrA